MCHIAMYVRVQFGINMHVGGLWKTHQCMLSNLREKPFYYLLIMVSSNG
jgi:hypothetical protein